MSEAFWDLADEIQFCVIGKTADNFQAVEKVKQINYFDGVMLPLPDRVLEMKPEGQRSWRWQELYTDAGLKPDWVIVDTEGNQYRVMAIADWSKGGYQKYHIAQEPKSVGVR